MSERKGNEVLAALCAAGCLVIGICVVCLLKWLKIQEQAVIVALLLVPVLIYGVASGRLREFTGPGGWSAKFAALETEIAETKNKVEELFLMSMSDAAFSNLKKLSDGWDGEYWLDPDLRSGLAGELTHFKLLGYINFTGKDGVFGVGNLPTGNKQNLSQYITLSPTGKDYVRSRQAILDQQEKAK